MITSFDKASWDTLRPQPLTSGLSGRENGLGHGIAQDFASAGSPVVLYEAGCLGPRLHGENLQTMAGLHFASGASAEDVLSRVSMEISLPAVAGRCDCVVEDLQAKRAVRRCIARDRGEEKG